MPPPTPGDRETTLLIHPWVLADFTEYNDFLEVCDAAVAELDLEGELQVASFHPQYQFAESQPDDIENYTNRSPFPMLHLLREASVERAVAAVSDSDGDLPPQYPHLARPGACGLAALMARLAACAWG